MMKTNIRDLISYCASNVQQLQLSNTYDDYTLDCIPLAISRQLLLVQYIYNFYLDGHKVLRMKDINSAKRGDIEEYHDFILKQEGIDLENDISINIASWKSVFSSLVNMGILIDLATESPIYGERTFFVGRPIKINKDRLIFEEIDVLGKWISQTIEIPLACVTEVSYKSRYLSLLHKYQDPTH